MFILNSARVRAHTGRETSAPKNSSAHIYVPSKYVFCTYFIHVIPNSDEFRQNVAQKNFYAHIDFKKLEGTLDEL